MHCTHCTCTHMYTKAGISKNSCATNWGSPEVNLRFCPWPILLKYWPGWPYSVHVCLFKPGLLFEVLSESVATLPPFSPIEGQKWFDQISSQWESQKNRFALIYFGKIKFLPPCIWNLPFMSTASEEKHVKILYGCKEGRGPQVTGPQIKYMLYPEWLKIPPQNFLSAERRVIARNLRKRTTFWSVVGRHRASLLILRPPG